MTATLFSHVDLTGLHGMGKMKSRPGLRHRHRLASNRPVPGLSLARQWRSGFAIVSRCIPFHSQNTTVRKHYLGPIEDDGSHSFHEAVNGTSIYIKILHRAAK